MVPPLRQVLVSRVIGATIGQSSGSIQLNGSKVEILLSTLNLDRYEVNQSSATCVYWDVSIQEWSSDGCELLDTNGRIYWHAIVQKVLFNLFLYTDTSSTTRCQCDHLTNFAVLMDINGLFKNNTVMLAQSSYQQNWLNQWIRFQGKGALDYITIIGGSISIACLALAVIIFYSLRNLRRDFHFHIHRNLCLNLLIADILLLVGLEATVNKDLCISIAVFLHLFFLFAFGWMLAEGLYMYILVTSVRTCWLISFITCHYLISDLCKRFSLDADWNDGSITSLVTDYPS